MSALKVVCAWCHAWLRGPADGEPSHTICGPCVVKYFPAQALAMSLAERPVAPTCACCKKLVRGRPAGQRRLCGDCVVFIDPSFSDLADSVAPKTDEHPATDAVSRKATGFGTRLDQPSILQGGAAWLARQPHNLKVAGSNPAPATRIGTSETERIDQLPAVGECAESPEGPGTDGYKPLMRNRAPMYAASANAMIAGNTFALTTHGAVPPTPADDGSPAGVFIFMRKLLIRLFGPARNRRGKRLHRWLALNRSVVQI